RRFLRRRLRERQRLADARSRGRRGERRPRLAMAAPFAVPPLCGFRLRRPEELEHPQAGCPRARGRVPARVRGRGALGPRRHGRNRLPDVAAARLSLAARRHGLRRPPYLRAHRQAGRGGLNFDLTPEQQLVRDTVRKFAESRIAPVAAELDREHRFPYELVAELAELRLLGKMLPEVYVCVVAVDVSQAVVVLGMARDDSYFLLRLRCAN